MNTPGSTLGPVAEQVVLDRRHLHAHPELGFQEERTSELVASCLRSFGIEVHRGIGKTGVVGIIKGRNAASGKVVGLRADMDALPIQEGTGLPYASKVVGKMHACGHDGHTAMLLGAARVLAAGGAVYALGIVLMAVSTSAVAGP